MIPPKAIRKIEKRMERIRQWRYRPVADVPLEMAETVEHYYQPPTDLDYKSIANGFRWGADWLTVWFRGTAQIPADCQGKEIYYRLSTVAEMLVFVDGRPLSGMSPARPEVRLVKNARAGKTVPFYVEAYSGHLYPGGHPFPGVMRLHQCCHEWADKAFPHVVGSSELLVRREEVYALYYDADVLLDTARTLDENSLRKAQIIDGLNEAFDLIPFFWEDEKELEAGCHAARSRIAPLLALENGPTTPFVGIVGHAHMDIAWLWPLKETVRKTARTFSSMLNLIEDYPEFTFMQSQPVLCQMAEDYYPSLIEPLKKAFATGNWQPNGGMWVESDCNIPSGESLVRQFVEGRKKTMEVFGYCGDTLWLPDVFGYSPALPQIMKGCGIKYFVTAKLNANDTNPFPHATFDWEGIDGTTVFAHRLVCQERGYNAQVTPTIHKDCWDHVPKKEIQDSTLSAVGYGDGGGGATREMCEYARRMKDLEGCIKTDFVNVSDFLAALEQKSAKRPRWMGELYFEEHRGTYTAQARTKRYNRKLEFLLREVELLFAQIHANGGAYPSAQLERHWRTLLTNQFHDILAGSSIRNVHEVGEEQYRLMTEDLTDLKREGMATLAKCLNLSGQGNPQVLHNPLAWRRQAVVEIPEASGGAYDQAGNPLAAQPLPGTPGTLCVAVDLAPLSLTPIYLRDEPSESKSPFKFNGNSLDTPFYRATFDGSGKITGLYDKQADRELVQTGRRLNDLYTADDIPTDLDAWNIDLYYRDTLKFEDRLQSREVLADGPLLFSLRSCYQIGRKSTLVQEMIFYARNQRIDFRTRVDWQESHRLLKAGFALDIHAEHYRTETQFGHIHRPVHANNSYEQAKFEVCAHKWIDISESDYGVALLNDSKYGHDSLDRMLSITLLTSSRAPDELADVGEHFFTYSLLPHRGAFSAESVVHEAYELNVPVSVLPVAAGNGKETHTSFCSTSNPNAVIEAVKKAEADDGVIVRVYEAGNTRGPVALTFCKPVRWACTCNLVETEGDAIEPDGKTVLLHLRPFEIKTLKVRF